MTIMATRIPIWTAGSKKAPLEFQVSTSSASVKSHISHTDGGCIMITIVCVHAPRGQVYVPREPPWSAIALAADVRLLLWCGQDGPRQLGMLVDLSGRS